jgi:hypothetical protein
LYARLFDRVPDKTKDEVHQRGHGSTK